MEYVVSRPYELPRRRQELATEFFFNLWGSRYWPYQLLEVGDILYWYHTTAKRIVWRSRTAEVQRFTYDDKESLAQTLTSRFAPFEQEQPYFADGANSGYCLAYKVEPLEPLDRAKPDALRFPQLGWLKVESRQVRDWVGAGHQD